MKAITPKLKLPMTVRRFVSGLACFTALGIVILSAGCLSIIPVDGVPITIEERGFYKTQHTFAYYRDNTLFVEGEIKLASSITLSQSIYFEVQVFDAGGKVLGRASARLEQNEKTFRGDMRLNASFKAHIQVPLAQVARIKVRYIPTS